eukprot:TRINITY_DN3746_c0_g2_i1.p1 TRINITY_DN3746_c0_g2~~TRINITY_DN3746_c0_g2_i1.p1  ORF type:complete len:419 (+),score=141.20 TRINITY_DN3746_c0_g2_i1:68-1324(+)
MRRSGSQPQALGAMLALVGVVAISGLYATQRLLLPPPVDGGVTAEHLELVAWKEAAREYLTRNTSALRARLQSSGRDLSPLYLAFFRGLAKGQQQQQQQHPSPRPPSGQRLDPQKTHLHGARGGLVDKEFFEEELAETQRGDGKIAAVWPPPPDNAGDVNATHWTGLPSWDHDRRTADITRYYKSIRPHGELLDQLRKVLSKVWRNWDRNRLWQSYPSEDISDCPRVVPECLFWGVPEVNTSLPGTAVVDSSRSYRKCCVEHRKMWEVTRNTFRVLYNAGVRFWLGDGTLLGARRGHGTIIPWDTDVDVFITSKEKAATVKALRAAHASGELPHAWEKDPHGRNMFWVYWSKKKQAGDSHMEIWVTDGLKQRRNNFSLVFPLQPCPFFDFTALCPNKVDRILEIAYGDWQTPNKNRKV